MGSQGDRRKQWLRGLKDLSPYGSSKGSMVHVVIGGFYRRNPRHHKLDDFLGLDLQTIYIINTESLTMSISIIILTLQSHF